LLWRGIYTQRSIMCCSRIEYHRSFEIWSWIERKRTNGNSTFTKITISFLCTTFTWHSEKINAVAVDHCDLSYFDSRTNSSCASPL